MIDEKQDIKKVVNIYNSCLYGKCPVCDELVLYPQQECKCGQRLNWGSEAEK